MQKRKAISVRKLVLGFGLAPLLYSFSLHAQNSGFEKIHLERKAEQRELLLDFEDGETSREGMLKNQAFLRKRGSAGASALLQNPEGLNLDIGLAISGMIWSGDHHVCFSAPPNAIRLCISKTDKMPKNDISMEITGLQYDEKERVYNGTANWFGRTRIDCPTRTIPAQIKITPRTISPFAGAWHSIEVTLNLWTERDCKKDSVEKEAKAVYSRVYTSLDYLKAAEQLAQILTEINHKVSATTSNILNAANDAKLDMEDKDYLSSVIQKQRDILNATINQVSEIDRALRFGGSVLVSPNQRLEFKQRAALDDGSEIGELLGPIFIQSKIFETWAPELRKLLSTLEAAAERLANNDGKGTTPDKDKDSKSQIQSSVREYAKETLQGIPSGPFTIAKPPVLKVWKTVLNKKALGPAPELAEFGVRLRSPAVAQPSTYLPNPDYEMKSYDGGFFLKIKVKDSKGGTITKRLFPVEGTDYWKTGSDTYEFSEEYLHKLQDEYKIYMAPGHYKI